MHFLVTLEFNSPTVMRGPAHRLADGAKDGNAAAPIAEYFVDWDGQLDN